jgi:ABC-type glycerol-3-phosphate transport system substrate-binding protein
VPATRLALAAVAAALVLAGCGAAASTRPPAAPTAATTAPAAVCAWYTPTAPQGQQVILTTTGQPCGAAAPAVEFAAVHLRRVWYSTSLDFGGEATLIAQLRRGAVVVRIFQLGASSDTMNAAGLLADDFQAAGWVPQLPTGPQGPAPSISYSTAVGA